MSKNDVIICGGGLAGLTLALQLKRLKPELRIVVLEKKTGPLPEATHTVGESTVEIGAHYLAEVIGLKEHLQEAHLPKLGLRYFYENGSQPLEKRPELGASMFSPVPTYQLDRGILENHLRKRVVEVGVTILEGVSVTELELSNSNEPHTIQYQIEGELKTLSASWVVDAMGRRRFIQRKLGLNEDSGHAASSVWFRVKGKVSVNDLVPASEVAWHSRNLEDRFLSTNHLMGTGYWVWLIPLSSGNTSIGIVTQNDIHDFTNYSRTYETAHDWLKENEPFLAECLENKEVLDFKKLKNYSYGSKQLFSENRWACVGEAGVFSDPFYSPGSDMIALTNTMTTNLILADGVGKMNKEDVDLSNDLLLDDIFPDQLKYYRNMYNVFGNTSVSSVKFMWDTIYYWRVYAHQFMKGTFTNLEELRLFRTQLSSLSLLNDEAQRIFSEWASKTDQDAPYSYVDLASKHVFIESAINLLTKPTGNEQEVQRFMEEMLSAIKKAYLTDIESGLKSSNLALTADKFSTFAEFFGSEPPGQRRKRKWVRRIASIQNGKMLYVIRDQYVRRLVVDKPKALGFGVLKLFYPH